MFLIQLLLPSTGDATGGDPRLRETQRELVARFGGATAYLRAPASGEWTSSDGSHASDTVVMVEVVAPHFERGWWKPYARTLAARFDQEVVHIRATAIEMVDESAT